MELTVDGRKVHAATGGRPFDAGKPAVIFIHGADRRSKTVNAEAGSNPTISETF